MHWILLSCLILPLPVAEEKYVYIEDTSIRYYHHIGSGIWCEGTLNQRGVFKADINDLEKSLEAHKNKVERKGPFAPKLVEARTPNEKVYEFRSGVLVPMIIDEKRGLIPDIKGEIIAFNSYQYHPSARRIYNLPGRYEVKK